MSDPLRQSPNDTAARGQRATPEDPLEELARILGETAAQPVRPENVGEVGRRATPTLPMPQQLSALEVELFDELRSSVTPESRVRGTFAPEVMPVRPQQPADDHDIAALRIDPPTQPEQPTGRSVAVPAEPAQSEVPWSDYYGWDDGVAAGSYDPAFAGGENRAPAVGGDEFGRDEIARAAAEADPYAVPPAVVAPRSERTPPRLDTGRRGGGLGRRLGFGVFLLAIVGGGAWAGLKYLPSVVGGSGPTIIHADGKPLKVVPDPKAPVTTDSRPSLAPDPASGASRIVSLQEDPVDQVSGRTPEGKEVRVINPGVQRAGSDQPHTVKTVVVRPDGTVVSDGGSAPRPTAVRTTAIGPDGRPVGGAPSAVPPTASAVPPIQLQLPPSGQPLVSAQPPIVEQPPFTGNPPAAAAGRPISVPLPVDAPLRPTAAQKPAAPAAPVAAAPVTPAPAVAAPTIKPPPAAAAPAPRAPAPAPVATARPPAAPAGAPLSLTPGASSAAPRVAAAPPAAAAPIAAPAAAASGDWVVQIAATKSDADARRSFADAQRRYSALSGRSVDVQQANLGERGVFYRARVPAGSREQAVALCEQLKSQGGQCLVARR